MREILEKLDAVLSQMGNKSVLIRLKGSGSEMTELLEALREGSLYVRRARAAYRRAHYLMEKGYGRLAEPGEG